MKKTIRSDGRKIIYNVYQACTAERESSSLLPSYDNVFARVAMLTGKSERTVRRIIKEGQQNDGIFVTPGKHRSGRPKKQLDDFDICAIRQKIQFWYTVKKEVPALRKLLAAVKEELKRNYLSSDDEVVATTSTPNEYFEDVQYLDFDDL